MTHVGKLNKAERGQLEAVAAELKPWGLGYELDRTKHLMVVIAGPPVPGRQPGHWRLTLACTPRDADAAVGYARHKARQIIRDINQRLGL